MVPSKVLLSSATAAPRKLSQLEEEDKVKLVNTDLQKLE